MKIFQIIKHFNLLVTVAVVSVIIFLYTIEFFFSDKNYETCVNLYRENKTQCIVTMQRTPHTQYSLQYNFPVVQPLTDQNKNYNLQYSKNIRPGVYDCYWDKENIPIFEIPCESNLYAYIHTAAVFGTGILFTIWFYYFVFRMLYSLNNFKKYILPVLQKDE